MSKKDILLVYLNFGTRQIDTVTFMHISTRLRLKIDKYFLLFMYESKLMALRRTQPTAAFFLLRS
jgi:hypothetical protein